MLLALLAACGADSVPPLSYDRCNAGEACGLGTTCLAVPVATGAPSAMLCTRACVLDDDCPGLHARCVQALGAAASDARCLRACATNDECRVGTRCVSVTTSSGTAPACVPDTGDRTCTDDGACAPLAQRCVARDGGVSICQ